MEQGNDHPSSETKADFETAKQLPGASPGELQRVFLDLFTTKMPPEAGGCRFVLSSVCVLLHTALCKGTGWIPGAVFVTKTLMTWM